MASLRSQLRRVRTRLEPSIDAVVARIPGARDAEVGVDVTPSSDSPSGGHGDDIPSSDSFTSAQGDVDEPETETPGGWSEEFDPFAHWAPSPVVPEHGASPAPQSRFPRRDPEPDEHIASNPGAAELPVPTLPPPAPVSSAAVGGGPGIPSDAPRVAPESSDPAWPGAPVGWEPQEVDPRGLRDLRLLRPIVLASQAAIFPAALVGPVAVGVAAVVMVVALAAWTSLAAANAARAKPRTSLRSATAPTTAARWWLVPVAYTVVASAALSAIDRWAGDARATNDRDVLLTVVAVVALVGGVIAWYWPFGRLAGISRWVGGGVSAIRRWFWTPLLVGVFTGTLLRLLSLSVLGGFGEDPGSSAVVVVASWIGVIAPMGAVAVAGQRAMLEVEGRARETYLKRSMPPIDPSDLLARRARIFGDEPVAV